MTRTRIFTLQTLYCRFYKGAPSQGFKIQIAKDAEVERERSATGGKRDGRKRRRQGREDEGKSRPASNSKMLHFVPYLDVHVRLSVRVWRCEVMRDGKDGRSIVSEGSQSFLKRGVSKRVSSNFDLQALYTMPSGGPPFHVVPATSQVAGRCRTGLIGQCIDCMIPSLVCLSDHELPSRRRLSWPYGRKASSC